ncbi:alpha/beta-Hydrolases superfamily protein [Rhynchospora pubera]|uniref:Alpha/beta-Hydrolases superfamily protein n=1 Tax=Rhynchospora pubera TaxID=906938 RepID=A0AAV8BTS2_9POAL|nr:alpha/beta-Hydrolases superfamily protein [Rhynchospora pubera]
MGDLGVCKEEAINGAGGTDLWSSSDGCTVSKADHLVVMVHGILGSNANWKFAAEHFVKMLPDKVLVHCSERNMNKLTLDGVDVMGERLAEEVTEVIKGRLNLCKISFVAHSIGGLVARYAIGRLYRPPRSKSFQDSDAQIPDIENSRGTICGLEAMNFITIATPHLGSRGNKQVPFLFGLTAMEKLACHVIHLIFRQTGRHLFLVDSDDGKPPLLQRMVEDSDDLYFMSALQAFKRRVVYSNVAYDHIVGWRTSSIRRNSELPKFEETPNKIYPHVVHEEISNGENPDKCNEAIITSDDYDMIEENLVRGLRRVSWEKVDVSFHTSKVRFAAHSVIQVKDPVMHSEGADVIQHIIDHFLLT